MVSWLSSKHHQHTNNQLAQHQSRQPINQQIPSSPAVSRHHHHHKGQSPSPQYLHWARQGQSHAISWGHQGQVITFSSVGWDNNNQHLPGHNTSQLPPPPSTTMSLRKVNTSFVTFNASLPPPVNHNKAGKYQLTIAHQFSGPLPAYVSQGV